jgi:hypothetical protein
MARTPGGRSRISIGILLSITVHAVALAVVTIEIPEPRSAPGALSIIATAPTAEPPVEPVLQVIEIRPPGTVLPSGGSAGAAAAVPNEPPTASPRALTAAVSPGASPSLRSTGSIELAPRAPVAEFSEVVLASTSGVEADPSDEPVFRPDPRPGRGVVLKSGGSDWQANGSGVGTAGRGYGISLGGLTVTGTGGDCITPGLARPDDTSLTNRRDGGLPDSNRIRGATLGNRGGIRPRR